MVYPSNFELRVGFDRIREAVMSRCTMLSAREVIAHEGFTRSRREVFRNFVSTCFNHDNLVSCGSNDD